MNKWVEVEKKRRKWVAELGRCEGLQGWDRGWRRTGREGTARQRGIVLVHQALGDTLKHIHSFTHWHGRAHRRMLLPTATQDLRWHLGGQPHLQSSPGCRSWSTLSTSVHPTSGIEPPMLCSLPVDWTEFSRPSFTTPSIPTDLRKQRTNNTELWTKGSSESTSFEVNILNDILY